MKIQRNETWHWKIAKHPMLNVWFWGCWMFTANKIVPKEKKEGS